jgi:hypothetical protein
MQDITKKQIANQAQKANAKQKEQQAKSHP